MEKWYVLGTVAAGSEATGPFDLEQLRAMVGAGSLTPSTQVARVGSQAWAPAASDPDLAALFGAAHLASPAAPPPLAMAPTDAAAALPPYSFSNAFSLGWRAFKTQWPQLLAAALIYAGLSFIMALPQFLLNGFPPTRGTSQAASAAAVVGGCFEMVVGVLAGIPLATGLVYAGAQAVRGRANALDLFAPFKRYGSVLASGLLVGLVYVGCAIAGYAFLFACLLFGGVGFGRAGAGVGGIIGMVLCITVIVILVARVVCRILLAPVICADPAHGNVSAMDAIRLSWANTKGISVSMFGVLFVVGLIAVATVFLLCVGYILVGVPLVIAVYGALHVLANRR
ncbi:MAG: DUF4339 domain-containing protein [Phycisphaerales bacterium]